MKERTVYISTLIGALVLAFGTAVAAYLGSDFPMIWKVCGGLAIAAFLAHIGMNFAFYKEVFSKRTTHYGMRAVLISTLIVAIVIVVNLIAAEHDWKKDFTKNKLHTLSDQSIKIVEGLKDDVVMKAFVNPQQIPEFEKVFSRYTYYSKKLKREFVDVDRDALDVKHYNIKSAGTLVIESGDRNVRVENLMGPDDPKLEEKITNALISVIKGGKKKLYYVSGHGERLLSDTGREGYSQMKEALENSRYQVEELVLLEKGAVPADAELLMIAGPKSEFMEQETKALENYIRGGGKAIIMMEPTSPASLKPFLAKFGADFNPKKVILETNSLQQLAGGNPLTPIVTTYDRTHEITKDAKQLTLFPIATPIEKTKDTPAGETVVSLMSTSSKSLETDLKGDKVQVNQAKDRKGPLSLALAISGKVASAPDAPAKDPKAPTPAKDNKEKEFRMVVIGDSDFASNSARQFGMNSDLFQNMMSWLAQEEDLIAIRPRPANESEFEITEQRSRIINLASIVFAPLMMFLSGLGVWITRRRR